MPAQTNTSPVSSDFASRLVLETQAGLPLVPEPYREIAKRLGCSEEAVLESLQMMLANGRLRRIGVVPNHYRLGYVANGMSVWDVDDAEIDRVGALVGKLETVSHCYRRPRHLPDWPYNFFAMVHGRSREAVLELVRTIAQTLGDTARQHDVLFSTRILKKTGMRLRG